MGNSYVATDLDAVESFPGFGSKPEEDAWKPLRAKLGVEAFGVNAFGARAAGARVIERHTEEGSGHQELYVVLAGKARFELDDDEVEAKAGALVFISDPAVKRTAVALEPNTSVLAIGAPAGTVFKPSSWDDPFTAA